MLISIFIHGTYSNSSYTPNYPILIRLYENNLSSFPLSDLITPYQLLLSDLFCRFDIHDG